MYRLAVALFALTLAPTAIASCVTEKDAFSGTKVTAEVQHMGLPQNFGLMLEAAGGTARMTLRNKETGAVSGVVAAGTVVPVALADGTVLKLVVTEDTPQRPLILGDYVFTESVFQIAVDAATLQTLSTGTVVAFRVPTPRGDMDWKLSKKDQKVMSEAATCVLAAIQPS